MRALVVKEPWISYILGLERIPGLRKGIKKTWELRSRNTRIREKIGLIRKGSGLIIGTAVLIDSLPMKEKDLIPHRAKHGEPPKNFRSDSENIEWVWVLKGAQPLETPIPYKHPRGAVTWVTIPETP